MRKLSAINKVSNRSKKNWLFSTLCDNFCLWNREMFTEKDFWDYFSEETIIIDLISTQKPEEPKQLIPIFNGRD